MALTYHVDAINNGLDEITALVDSGGTGKIKIRTAADADLWVANLASPSAPAASGGVLTWDFDPDISGAASATGTAAKFVLTNQADTVYVTGSVATSGADLNLDSVSITSGQTVTITSLAFTGGNA